MNQIDTIKLEIEELMKSLNKKKLSPDDKQRIYDTIAEKKRLIEKLSKNEKMVVPIVGTPVIAERKNSSVSRYMRDRVRI